MLQDDVLALFEGLIRHIFKNIVGLFLSLAANQNLSLSIPEAEASQRGQYDNLPTDSYGFLIGPPTDSIGIPTNSSRIPLRDS